MWRGIMQIQISIWRRKIYFNNWMGIFCIRGNLPGMVDARIKMGRGNIITSPFSKGLNRGLPHRLRVDLKDKKLWN